LDKCGHSFCTDCIDKAFKVKKQCPICYQAYGPLTGDQPEGKMIEKQPIKLTVDNELHAGIKICYEFPDGIQGPDHPNPGKPYKGTSETAYLLYSNEGNKVLRLLRRAFDQKLTFTIGQSPTAIEDVVMFTDIPHITSR
jgi:deltex-like protein